MTGRILTLTVLMAGVWAPAIQAQDSARERARAAVSVEFFQHLETVVAEAERAGIPEEALFDKALEGLAKHVPESQLLPAISAYAGRLGEARGAFGEWATQPLMVAGADALQRGIGVDVLRRLGPAMPSNEAERPEPPSAMAVLVLADLVESGVPPDRALDVVHEALRQRTREQQMLGIPQRVRQLMRQGQSPQDAANQVRRALQRGRGSGGVGPPIPPGSQPSTPGHRRGGGGGGGGAGGGGGGGTGAL